MEINYYKQVLHPHQYEGLENFAAWWRSLVRTCHLSGCAGSGKTYSLKHYIHAVGLTTENILLAAPTNVAAKKLSSAFDYEIDGMSIHRLYKLAPIKNSWGQKDQTELDQVQKELDRDDLPLQRQEELQQQFVILKNKAAAFAKNELFFAPSQEFDVAPKIKLIIIDEGSMVDDEMLSWVEMYTPVGIRVLFLCDEEQIYPVKKGALSKVFSTAKIANFDISVRSAEGSSLHGLIEKCRHVDFKTQLALLESLEELDDITAIAPGTAGVVSGVRDTKKLIQHYAKTYAPDGLEWRILAYKNVTVDNYNKKAKFSTGTKFLGQGDPMIVQSSISRGGFSNSWSGCKYFSVVDNGTMISSEVIVDQFEIDATGLLDFGKLKFLVVDYTPDFYGYFMEKHQDSVKCLKPEFESIFNFNAWCGHVHDPSVKLIKQTIDEDYLTTFVTPHPDCVDEYNRLCAYFTKLSLSFYRAVKNPEASDTIREFMKWFGELLGVNLATPKPLREWFKSYSGKDTNLVAMKNLVQRVGNAVSNIVDDVRYPFASTLHKSQGQTIDHVIIDLNDVKSIKGFSDDDAMKRLLYTGVSRAAKSLIVVL